MIGEGMRVGEAISLVRHHLLDLYKIAHDDIDSELKDEIIDWCRESVDDIESFIEDIQSEEY